MCHMSFINPSSNSSKMYYWAFMPTVDFHQNKLACLLHSSLYKALWRGLTNIGRFNTLPFFLIWFSHFPHAIFLERPTSGQYVVLVVRSVLSETTSEHYCMRSLSRHYSPLDRKISIIPDLKHSRTILNCDKFASHAERWHLHPTSCAKRFFNDENHCMII